MTTRQRYMRRYRKTPIAKAAKKLFAQSPAGKAAQRRYQHKSKYGIPLEERDRLFAAQGYVCAGCKRPDPQHPNGWQLDHSHKSGKVRGILCPYCNAALGFVKDDPTVLRLLAEYLDN
jgi:DNA-directed RNA polymerase subunit RPC12/RpoP